MEGVVSRYEMTYSKTLNIEQMLSFEVYEPYLLCNIIELLRFKANETVNRDCVNVWTYA